MTFDVTGSYQTDETARRYVAKVLASLERYLTRSERTRTVAIVRLDRIDRPNGNKYEASVCLKTGNRTHEASDSTLNVLAALDIVRLKLVRQLSDGMARLPDARNRV